MQRFVRTPAAYYERHTVFPFYPRPELNGNHELEVAVYSDPDNFKVLAKFGTHGEADKYWVKLTTELNLTDIDDIDAF